MDLEEYNYTMGSKSSFGQHELDQVREQFKRNQIKNFMEKTLSFIF
jgi:hypothetical protein